MNQNTAYAEYQDIRQNTPEYARRRIFGGMLLALLALSFCRFGAPAYAQSVTVTPLPGPIATATAAAAQMQQAQAQRQQADALTVQAAQLRQSSDALTASAQQAASDSRAALLAQQFGAASEAIGRAESDIASLKDNATQAQGIIALQSQIINAQYISLTQSSAELMQVRSENVQLKTINTALQQNNKTLIEQQQASDRSGGVLDYAWLLVIGLGAIAAIVAWMWWHGQRHTHSGAATVTARDDEQDEDEPPIEGEYRNETP